MNLCRSMATDIRDHRKGSRNRFFGTSLFSMQKKCIKEEKYNRINEISVK